MLHDHRLLRLGGLALPAAVWLLAVVTPARSGLTPAYLVQLSATTLAIIGVDLWLTRRFRSTAGKVAGLGVELCLCFALVSLHGTLIRPALIYLLPASRAITLFGERPGLAASALVWAAYGVNVAVDGWPDRLVEYFPNYFSFFLAPYLVAVTMTVALVRQSRDRDRLQRMYDELQRLHAHVRETAVVEERNRLAREIHDSVAHYMTIIAVQLEAAEKVAVSDPDGSLESVKRARRLALQCLRELRNSVTALRSGTLEELSLQHAIRELAAEFAASTGIAVRLAIDLADDARPAAEASLALYRAAQEGLTNVQRHARATAANLSLCRDAEWLVLRIEDDGVGPVTPQSVDDRGGFGLVGLRERLALLGGTLVLRPAPGRGAMLEARVPAPSLDRSA
jgi:signal transduction histidine kinase